MASKKNLSPLKPQPAAVKGYHPEGDELKVYDQYRRRKTELLNSRRNVYGLDIDEQMRRWDRNYFNRIADIPASELDPDQTPVAINNAFGKVQAALGILVDRNPEITLEESGPQFSANRELIKGLAKNSFRVTNSIGQLKLSIFNMAKRGWFVGRTFYRSLKHDARFLERIDDDGKGGSSKVYRTQSVSKVDDVAYMNINNFNAWIDEQTVPEDFYSTRDWMWREVWHIDDLRKMFPESEYPNMRFVQEGGDTRETIHGTSDRTQDSSSEIGNEAKSSKKGMTEVFYYENQYDDWFIVEINGVMVVWEPLPQQSKRLSCTYGYWNLRGAETIYGIGIVEAMERDESLIDRIVNMTMRQLLLTISPPGFYTGVEDPDDENLKYKPGVLRRTMDPQSIKFLEIPEGNKDSAQWLQWLENKEDQRTGVTRSLEGEVGDKNSTAFETGVNREAGLKRLRLPLKSIQYALEWEFTNRISLIKQVYTDFQVEQISDPEDIMNYLDEVRADPDYYFIENEGNPGGEQFFARRYRQVQLNVEQDEQGNFQESQEKKFFNIKPDMLRFEGGVMVDAGSILVTSEELEKADTLRMANIIVPLVQKGDPKVVGRPVTQLLRAFNKDPKAWLPDAWLRAMQQQGKLGKTGAGGTEEAEEAAEGEVPGAEGPGEAAVEPGMETVVPSQEIDGGGTPGLGQRFSAAFRAFRNPRA